MFRRALLSAICTGLLTTPLLAQNFPPTIDMRLEAAANPFETGAYQTLGAAENFLQSLYRYGIGRGFVSMMTFRTREFENPMPEVREPDTFRRIVLAFSDDLNAARETLAQTDPDRAVPFVIDLKEIWFDVNDNGHLDDGEAAVQILGQILPRRSARASLPDGPAEVRFDGADHAWLTAYSHVWSATAEAILAFDPTPVFEDLAMAETALAEIPTIPNTYDVDEILARVAGLKRQLSELNAARRLRRDLRRPLQKELGALQNARRKTQDDDEKEALEVKIRRISEELEKPEYDVRSIDQSQRFLRQQIDSATAKLPPDLRGPEAQRRANNLRREVEDLGDAWNAVYALLEVLRTPPDPDRIANVERHLRAMLSQNRLFWEKVALETDNDREWLPNPSQTSAFGLEVDANLAEAWLDVLQDAEAVLDGRLLVPHPILPPETGINVAAWFDSPSALDPIGWIHGRDAYPYLARGPYLTRESWRALQRMTQGNALAFSIYLN